MNEDLELKKIDEQQFLTTKDKYGYLEEYITLKFEDPKENVLLNYSLSNNLDDIRLAILNRTNLDINIKKASWKYNTELSIYVKQLMKKHHVSFSMTTYDETIEKRTVKVIVINMHIGDNWFYTRYGAIKDKYYNMDYFVTLEKLKRFIEKYLSEDDIDD